MRINKNLSVLLPVYNEEENIDNLIDDLNLYFNQDTDLEYELIFIDNASKDNSYKKLINSKLDNKQVYLNEENILYSGSVARGIKLSKGEFIAIMDTDMQFMTKDIFKILKYMMSNKNDIVFGSRKKRKDGLKRILYSKIFNFLSKIIFNCHLKDLNTGIKIIRKKSFENFESAYKINMINPEFYAYAILNNLSIGEIDINHQNRIRGNTSHNINLISAFKIFFTVISYFIFIRKLIKS